MAESWKKFWDSPIGKGLLAILRNAAIVAAGLIVTGLVTLVTGADIDPMVKAIIIVVLKQIDEFLHKTGIAEKGLTRF